MTNGVCIVAQNNSNTDYVRQAYALSLSILKNNPKTCISLITNDEVSSEYNIFDKVISIPWGDAAKHSDWKIDNRWKVYHVTPYRNTIVFDADMLVLENIDYIWSNESKLNFTSNVTTFRNELATSRYYRKTFDANNLPNVYTGMYSFSKCPETHEFFVLLDIIMKNWKLFYKKFSPKKQQGWCSFDVSVAIAIKILGKQKYYLNNQAYGFTHLKPYMQNLTYAPQKCFDLLKMDFGDNGIFINGYKQHGILHYVEDEYLTDELINYFKEQV